jgi:cytochrome c oxidase subunit 1
MATQEIALPGVRQPAVSLIDRLHGLVITVDHKKLGLMYVGTAIVFLIVAGLMAVAIRLQLAIPNNNLLGPDVFNRFFTMHGTAMVFLVGMPIIAGLGNYLVPLMIGTRDMAFPRLNAFGYWMFLFGGLLLYFSYLGAPGLFGSGSAPDVGWFAYAPLTGRAFSRGHSTDYWILSLLLTSVGSTVSAINVIVTALTMRCRGMTLMRMPLFVWMMIVTNFMIILALPALSAAQIMLLIDRYLGGHFFDTQLGGSAVLWQHFFWIFGHPEVYILIIPAFACLSEIIPVFSRKPIFGYPVMVGATTMIAIISFSVWAHHMFSVGMTSMGNTFFAISTMLVSVPTGIKIFNWLGTMYGGKIRLELPMIFCLGFPISGRGSDRHHAGGRPFRLAAHRFLFRRRTLSLHAGWRNALRHLCRFLLLVSESLRAPAQPQAGTLAFLAFYHRLSSDVRHDALFGTARDASAHLHV